MSEPLNYSKLDFMNISDVETLRNTIKHWQNEAVRSEYKLKVIQGLANLDLLKDKVKYDKIIKLMEE